MVVAEEEEGIVLRQCVRVAVQCTAAAVAALLVAAAVAVRRFTEAQAVVLAMPALHPAAAEAAMRPVVVRKSA